MFKVNNKDTRMMPTVNFEHISHLVLMFLLLTLNMQLLAGKLWVSTKFLRQKIRYIFMGKITVFYARNEVTLLINFPTFTPLPLLLLVCSTPMFQLSL